MHPLCPRTGEVFSRLRKVLSLLSPVLVIHLKHWTRLPHDGSVPGMDTTKLVFSTPLLSAEEERELARRIEAGVYARHLIITADRRHRISALMCVVENGSKARETLFRANLRLVMKLTGKAVKRTGLPLDDLFQEGCLALGEAIQHFDPHTWHTFQHPRSRVRVAGPDAFRAHTMRKPGSGEARRRKSSPDTVHGPGPGAVPHARMRWWIRRGGALLHGFPRPAGCRRNGAETPFRNRDRLPHARPGRSRARNVGDEHQTHRGTCSARGASTFERGALPDRGHQERLCSRRRLRRSSSPVSSSNIALCGSGSLTGSVR